MTTWGDWLANRYPLPLPLPPFSIFNVEGRARFDALMLASPEQAAELVLGGVFSLGELIDAVWWRERSAASLADTQPFSDAMQRGRDREANRPARRLHTDRRERSVRGSTPNP